MSPVEALKHLRLGHNPWEAAFGEDSADGEKKKGRTRWWTPSTMKRVQKDNERLFRKMLC